MPRHPLRRSSPGAPVAALVVAALVGTGLGAPAAAAPVAGAADPADPVHRRVLQSTADGLVRSGQLAAVITARTPDRASSVAAGARDRENRVPARPGDRFFAASNTKTVTATLVMQLVDAGRWRLDSTVEQVWPGLLGARGRQVTLEQLLAHRSGIPDGIGPLIEEHLGANTWEAYVAATSRPYPARQVLSTALARPWRFTPGTRGEYSNTGYVVLGLLLERVARQPFAELARERVLRPAGAADSEISARSGIAGPALVDTFRSPEGRWYSHRRLNPAVYSSAGALVSSTADLARVNRALLTGRLVSRASLSRMQQVRTVSGLPMGLGLMRLPDPCPTESGPRRYVWGHNGALTGTGSWVLGSADGRRQVALAATGSDLDPAADVRRQARLLAAARAALRTTC